MVHEITESETAAYRVWHNTYLVEITAAFTDNPASVELYGTPTTQNRQLDLDHAAGIIRTYRTIPQLAKLLAAGSHVSFVKSKDTLKVYNVVRSYLKEHAETLSHTSVFINVDAAERARIERVMAGIQLLIEFVNAVQDFAKMELNQAPIQRAMFGLDTRAVFGSTLKQTNSIDTLPEDASQIFLEHLTAPELKEAARSLTWQ